MGDPRSFWGRLAAGERDALVAAGVRRAFPAGAVLCRQGDTSHHVLVLLTGHVRVTRVAMDGRQIVAGVRGPGDVLGELAAVDARPRSATVTALVDVGTLTVSGQRFAALCQTRPRIAWVLLGVVADRLRESGRQFAEFGGGHTAQRVAALLLELAVREGKPAGDAVEITLWSGQRELAAAAATSRESVARALRMLREQGLVSTRRGHVTIHDVAGLRRLAS
ncbi:MAG TPA: Crp/Fnr family transcriptional regulator [Pseudonocardiaceae bacterium]|nr:Crp/Fnr family transcriptional regulator [Pseudonocardiaceae bacterium]